VNHDFFHRWPPACQHELYDRAVIGVA
jgi:hypothetical protein